MNKIFLHKTARPRALIFGTWHHLVNLYQVFQNMAMIVNKTYNHMLANILPLHLPLTPGVASKVFFSF